MKAYLWAIVGGLVLLVGVIVAATLLQPQTTNPAYEVAIAFTNAASKGADESALPLLSADLQTYVTQNCRAGLVSECVQSYTPPEWGGMLQAVFRRGQPDGATAWDVQLVATYAEGVGFSGVCIYNRVEKIGEQWLVTRWSGWVHCGDPNSGLTQLKSADAANHAP
jgi:hypothetical protein